MTELARQSTVIEGQKSHRKKNSTTKLKGGKQKNGLKRVRSQSVINDLFETTIFDTVIETFRKKVALERSHTISIKDIPRLELAMHVARAPTVHRSGRQRVREILYWIEMLSQCAQPMPIILTSAQMNIVWEMIRATMTTIFKDDYYTEGAAFMQEMGWTSEKPFLLVLAWRQIGKTTVMLIFAAAFMLAVEYSTQNIFGTCRELTQMIIGRISDIYNTCELVHKQFLVLINARRIRILDHLARGDNRVITGYSSNKKTSRGANGRAIIYADEFAFIDQEFFMGTLVPMCADKKSSLIATTTVQGTDNHASILANLTDATGEHLINVIQILGICEKCRALDRGRECTHKATEIPDFKDEDKLNKIKQFYGSDTKKMYQEMGGQIVDPNNQSYDSHLITRLFLPSNAITLSENDVPEFVFTTFDPNGGGPSHLAAVSLCLIDGNVLVSIFFIFLF
jgi:hypothetical protein